MFCLIISVLNVCSQGMSSLISSLQKSLHGTYIYIVNVCVFFYSCKPIKPLKPSGKTVYFPFSHNSAGRVGYGYRSSGEVWHQDIGSGSFGSCGIQVKPRWINLLPAHPTDTWLEWEVGNALMRVLLLWEPTATTFWWVVRNRNAISQCVPT